MSTTDGTKHLPGAGERPSTKLTVLMLHWYEALGNIWHSLVLANRRRKVDAHPHNRRTAGCGLTGQLEKNAGASREPITTGHLSGSGETRQREVTPIPDERSHALALLCDRLLAELDDGRTKAGEIRFVVHKHDDPIHPRLDPGWPAGGSDGELVWELHRLIAWSGGTIADVAQALETRGADLDPTARELLKDELAGLEVHLVTLRVHLAERVDWDSGLECLLADEVVPFDDRENDENDENDE